MASPPFHAAFHSVAPVVACPVAEIVGAATAAAVFAAPAVARFGGRSATVGTYSAGYVAVWKVLQSNAYSSVTHAPFFLLHQHLSFGVPSGLARALQQLQRILIAGKRHAEIDQCHLKLTTPPVFPIFAAG